MCARCSSIFQYPTACFASLAAALVFSTLVPAFAITEADFTPAALIGKTLTFTIVNGGAPYPTNGTWTGTFAASGNGFTVANVTGDMVPVSTTYSAAIDGMFTDVSLAKFVEGEAPAKISLFILEGVARYEVVINGVFGVSLNGTFTIGSSVPKGPEIGLLDPKGKAITDNKSKQNFGTVQTGKIGATRKYTLKNTGTAKLSGLAITKSGANKGDFIVTGLGATSLAPGKSTTFKLSFKPASTGVRNAVIKIASNDADESTFDLKVTGSGAAK